MMLEGQKRLRMPVTSRDLGHTEAEHPVSSHLLDLHTLTSNTHQPGLTHPSLLALGGSYSLDQQSYSFQIFEQMLQQIGSLPCSHISILF